MEVGHEIDSVVEVEGMGLRLGGEIKTTLPMRAYTTWPSAKIWIYSLINNVQALYM